MNRLSQFIAMTTLVSSLACGSEGRSAGGAGGTSGGVSSARTGVLSTSGGGDAGAASAPGGSRDTIGGSGGSSNGGIAGDNTGGSNSQADAAGSSGAGAGGKAGIGGNAGTGPASVSGGATSGTSTGRSGTNSTPGSDCTTCHGDSAANDPSPPTDTAGNTETSFPGVGAHGKHLTGSPWHRQGQCADCHTQPTTAPHANGKVDFTWGTLSSANAAKPSFDTASHSCAGAYCHGATLPGSIGAEATPVWNQVNETWNACGTACHATPPPASTGHPDSAACEKCHSKVIASFAGTSAQTTWKDAGLHINGTVEVDTLTCTSCHGSGSNPAPPKDTQSGTAATAAGVGAHSQHLGTATWHRQGQCADCHKTPTSTAHANNTVDFTWGAPSNASGATPSFNAADLSCSGSYCHGAKMTDKSASIGHMPVWNKVDGTHDACGKACHANPPSSGSHTASSTACQSCHGDVIASFNGASSTWKSPALHINGKVEASAQTCDSCHGNPPNSGTHRRREHKVACTNCHPDPSGPTHRNGKTDQSCGSSRIGCHNEND